jgi:hypothetical protein
MEADVDIGTLPISEGEDLVRHIFSDIGLRDVDVGCWISDIADLTLFKTEV